MLKICSKCQQSKSPREFQANGRGGKRAACAVCLNAQKRGVDLPRPATTFQVEKVENAPVKVPIILESEGLGLFDSLREKHGSFMHLVIERGGRSRLQIHGNPTLTYKADSVEKVLEMALA